MGSRYEVEITITSAKDLKNVNWRHGSLKPYAVVWVDPNAKSSTRVDEEGDTCPYWDETLVIPFNSPIEDSTLYIDIVHAHADEDIKPLIGSARLRLVDVLDDAGLGRLVDRKLEIKRPSGRPHGKLEVQVTVREARHRAPDPYYAPPYGVPPPAYGNPYGAPPAAGSRDYQTPAPAYGNPYGAPPASAYGAPPSGYPYSSQTYGQPSYGQPGYGEAGYGQPVYGEEKKKSKFGGMGTGLAVGALAGALGGFALAEGIDHVEDKIAEDAAEKVEEDASYDVDAGDW